LEPSRDVEPVPSQQVDPLLYRIVVISLALVGVLALIIGFLLAMWGKEIPDAMWPIAAGAIASLGLLVRPTAATK